VAQQENYRKSRFALAYRNIRYGGTLIAATPPDTVSLADAVPLATLGHSIRWRQRQSDYGNDKAT
jgi:hypothetical protein